jgi:hypothetical protein
MEPKAIPFLALSICLLCLLDLSCVASVFALAVLGAREYKK